MPIYLVKDADGVTHQISGPAGATPEEVTNYAYQFIENQKAAEKAEAERKAKAEQEHLAKTGFFKNLSAGLTQGKGEAESYLGELTGSQTLKDLGAEAAAKAKTIAEPTTEADVANAPGILSTAGRWAEKNLLEPTGQFLGEWAAPIGAGIAGTLAVPEEAAVGLGGLALRGLAGKAASTVAGQPIMAGADIERQKEVNPDHPVNLLSASLAGAAQSTLFSFMPGAEKVTELIGPTVKAEADSLARKVIDGEMTADAAKDELSGKAITYARSALANTVNAAGVMTGNEAITRAQAGQSLTDEDARNAYLESLKAAAVLGPVAGAFGTGRGAALETLDQAKLRNDKINQINAERAAQDQYIANIHQANADAAAQTAADKEAQLRVMPTQQGTLPFETTVEDVAARRTEATPQMDMFNQSPEATMTMPQAEAPQAPVPPVEEAPAAPSTVLDHDTLTSFGFKKNSIAYKALEKLGDASADPELFNNVIEKNDHLIKTEENQAAVDKFRSTLDANRQVEDLGTANEPGLTREANQPSLRVSGRGKRAAARVAEEPTTGNVGDVGVPPVQPGGRETGKQAPLNVGDTVESGGAKFVKTENGFQRVEENAPATEKAAEVAPTAEKVVHDTTGNYTAEDLAKDDITNPHFDLLGKRIADFDRIYGELLPLREKINGLMRPRRADLERMKALENELDDIHGYARRAGGDAYWRPRTKLGEAIDKVKYLPSEAHLEQLKSYVEELKNKEPEEAAPAAEPTLAPNVAAQEKVQQRIADERAAAEQQKKDDRARAQAQAKAEQAGWEGRQVRRMTEAEKEGLAAAKEAELNEKEAPSTGASKIDMNEAKHVESSLEGKSQVEAAKWIAENAPDKDYRLIATRVAEQLQKLKNAGVNQALSIVHVGEAAPSKLHRHGVLGISHYSYDPKNPFTHVYLKGTDLGEGNIGTTYKTALHELIHAATQAIITFGNTRAGAGTKFSADVLRLNDVRNTVLNRFNRRVAEAKLGKIELTQFEKDALAGKHNALDNMDEMVTWALTDRDMQAYLESIPYKANQSVWSHFVNVIRDMLGLPAKAETALAEVLHVSDSLLSSDISEVKRTAENAGYALHVDRSKKPAPNAELNDILERSGSKHEAEPVTSNLFRDAVNDPGRIAAETKRGIAHALTKFETMVFSSNAALNKALRDGMKRAGISWDAMAHAMYNASDSQALHAQGVANEFIQRGDIRYDPLAHKYVVSGDGSGSWVGVINAIKEAAAAHGVPKDEMEQYAHRALEAKRLLGLSKRNDEIRAKVRRLQAEGKRADAEKMESRLVHIHMSDEQIKAGMEFFDKIPELKKVEQEWHTTRGKVLDFLVDTGITDREHADELMEAMDYVPFQRVEQIMNGAGYKEYSRGLLDAAVEKRIKGSEQPVNNIFDNMERWISYSIRRGINNKTAVDLADLALKYLPDETREVQKVSHGMENNTISIWRDGKKHMYEFDDPLYVHAFSGVQSVGIPAITAWSKFANLLRQNIVLNPLFSIGQLSQDAFGAMFTSGVKHPVAIPLEVMKEFYHTLRGTSGAHEELKAMGAVGHRDYSAAVSRIDAETEAGLRDPKLRDKLLKPLRHLSMASDNAVRQAIYNRTLLETGGRRVGNHIVGGDKAMAAERAFEIINFRRAGASQATTMLRQTVPFFGAYLQAMNVAAKTIAGRGIAPTERAAAHKTLVSTFAKVMALGFIYNSLISEDEDYKKLDPAVRDRLLLIPGSGGLHVPLRQDIFTLVAKVIPEHLYQMTMAEGTEDATKAKAAIGNAVMASLLSPNMIAQGAKPVIEVMTNHDFFTGRPIVGMGIDEREPYLQYSANTSELSKLLGSVGNISPMMIDHLLKAYTGYTGSMALMATSALVSAGSGKEMPDKELSEHIASIPGMSAFVSKEFGTRDLNDYYELRTMVNTAVKSYNNLKSTGQVEEAKEYRAKNKELLAVETQVNRINQALSKLRKQENILQESDKTGAEKEAALREIQLRRHKMLQNIDEVRKRAGL